MQHLQEPGGGGRLLLTRNGASRSGGQGAADSCNLFSQFADFVFKFPVVLAAIRKSSAQARVKLARSRSPYDLRDICAADSRAGDNDDPFPCGCDKFTEHRTPLWPPFRTASLQHSFLP